MLMRDEEGRKKEAKQHSTPKAVTFPKKNELPQGDMYKYMYMALCSPVTLLSSPGTQSCDRVHPEERNVRKSAINDSQLKALIHCL